MVQPRHKLYQNRYERFDNYVKRLTLILSADKPQTAFKLMTFKLFPSPYLFLVATKRQGGHFGGQFKNFLSKTITENGVYFPAERKVFVPDHQHGRHELRCKTVIFI